MASKVKTVAPEPYLGQGSSSYRLACCVSCSKGYRRYAYAMVDDKGLCPRCWDVEGWMFKKVWNKYER